MSEKYAAWLPPCPAKLRIQMIRTGLWTQPDKLRSIPGRDKHEVFHVNGPHGRQVHDPSKT